MQLLEVRSGAHGVGQVLATQLGAAGEELSDERAVEHLFEHVCVRERLFGSTEVAGSRGRGLSRGVERQRVDMRDERHPEENERFVERP